MTQGYLRRATLEDVASLRELIALSARSLGLSSYTPLQIEAALQGAFGVDTELIRDATYYLIEHESHPIACGGWSRREKPWGGDSRGGTESRPLDPETELAKIRAFFVHPDCARQGLATRLLAHCEREAVRHGFKSFVLTATLPGVPFYASRGYTATRAFEADLAGTAIEFVEMVRSV